MRNGTSAAEWMEEHYDRYEHRPAAIAACADALGVSKSAARKAARQHESSTGVDRLPDAPPSYYRSKGRKGGLESLGSSPRRNPVTEDELEDLRKRAELYSEDDGKAVGVAWFDPRDVGDDDDVFDEFMRRLNLDPDVWHGYKVRVQQWPVPVKLKKPAGDGTVYETLRVVNLLLVSAKFEARSGLGRGETRAWLEESVRRATGGVEWPEFDYSGKRPHATEMSLVDLHLGLMPWGERTASGEDYSPERGMELARFAVAKWLADPEVASSELFLLPVGNDLFNVDSQALRTVRGNFRPTDPRWRRTMRLARLGWCDVIERLRQVAPVRVVVLPGNHDGGAMFTFGEAIEARFEGVPGVEVDNSPSPHKAVAYGSTFIGYTHYLDEKARDHWPMHFVSRFKEKALRATYFEIHGGHKHREYVRSATVPVSKDFHGCVLRDMPSLCPPSAWEDENRYLHLRSAHAVTYDRDHGPGAVRIATLSELEAAKASGEYEDWETEGTEGDG